MKLTSNLCCHTTDVETWSLVSGSFSAPAPFTPASLFSSGESGGFWSVGVDQMFQLSNGTGAVGVGDPVGYLLDLSGNGNHLIQATAGKRPTYTESGGVGFLDFDGVDDSMSVPLDLSSDNKCTVIVGYKTVDAGGIRLPIGYAPAGFNVNGTFYFATQSSGSDRIDYEVFNGNQRSIITVAPADRTNRHVDSVIMDMSQTSNKLLLRRDGLSAGIPSQSGPIGTGNFASGKQLRLCDNLVGSGFSTAEISTILVIGRVLSEEELANAESWTAAMIGITL